MRQDHRASEKVFERRESEARHLVDATETKHARAHQPVRSWTASRDPSPTPTRDSAEASVRKEHWSAVLEVPSEVACCYPGVAGGILFGIPRCGTTEPGRGAVSSGDRDLPSHLLKRLSSLTYDVPLIGVACSANDYHQWFVSRRAPA